MNTILLLFWLATMAFFFFHHAESVFKDNPKTKVDTLRIVTLSKKLSFYLVVIAFFSMG